ncbi:YihY/virulence factor BrkB family protein [Clostridium baratii]|uniref:YihY family inner membrane domain protein n=1 Tax=Clostridium baratii str. Sullivan TaxID=1415775 RepID=A0A0A7FYZ6_9CLOT|nr:YihY/virulence factor BrkB family protein [Clostridium baratii]AIY84096.1 YihY family inner membrane domain protein [Clostridium baratii str. Sullivan]MDU1054253.1 YihY/virulence factor BrkB family protein [Clostridium baratii]MDU4912423.1 YihY/virulence factor BrkB family protein [Clostridium baratii]CUP54573.1 YihY family protein [Clostridium baratii]
MSKRMKGNNKSVLDTFLYLFIKVKRDDIFALASQLAYYLILSFFPFLIFLITLIGFSNLNNTEVLEGLQSILPTAVFELTASTISEVINSQNTGILGISGVLAIWAAASAFRAVIKGVNKAYDVDEDRSFIKRSIIGIISVIALALTIMCTLAMLVFGDLIGEFLNRFLPFEHLINFIWNILRYIIIIAMMIVVFAMIYKVAPAKRIKFRSVLPGAIITTIGWLIASLAFSYYVNNFSNYSRLYGSLWAVFVLMTWLFMTSIVFILGVEINSVLEKRKLM